MIKSPGVSGRSCVMAHRKVVLASRLCTTDISWNMFTTTESCTVLCMHIYISIQLHMHTLHIHTHTQTHTYTYFIITITLQQQITHQLGCMHFRGDLSNKHQQLVQPILTGERQNNIYSKSTILLTLVLRLPPGVGYDTTPSRWTGEQQQSELPPRQQYLFP